MRFARRGFILFHDLLRQRMTARLRRAAFTSVAGSNATRNVESSRPLPAFASPILFAARPTGPTD